jgi:hypothetical protein
VDRAEIAGRLAGQHRTREAHDDRADRDAPFPESRTVEHEDQPLLRAKRLEARPRIDVRVDGGRFHVLVYHKSHRQLADLRVTLTASDGRVFSLRPTGEMSTDVGVHARCGLLLYDTGSRGVELMRGRLPAAPDGTKWSEVRAVLRNPRARGEDPFAFVSEEVRIGL